MEFAQKPKRKKIRELEAKLGRLETVLQWYADELNSAKAKRILREEF
jgi:hypothetical protein